ncbi:MAG: arylsulfatase [Verrucomicrobiales bacterium]|nr:arylsulfatase [Verrucomicrobiales bacterium]
MSRKILLFTLGIGLFSGALSAEKPNLIFILADDLGYGDLGCFGQEKIKTPRLDAMATKGMKFTQFYAGSTVCAPSRCVLMTGQDTGHCWVRGNGAADAQTLRPDDITVAEKLKEAGYSTALMGKWGLGELGSTGHPNRQGFDEFFGYLNQRHAHNFYPEFLIRNEEVVKLRNISSPKWESMRIESGKPVDGAGFATPEGKIDYSHDLVVDETTQWVRKQAESDTPFFLYLALTIPHANNEAGRGLGDGQEVPDYGIYELEDWTNPDKGQAAMITRMDRDIGKLADQLESLGIAENTLIFFTSDNGHHKEGGNDPEFFDANGPLRGMKRDLTEGGIRVPTIAYWPGTVAEGVESHHIAGFTDWMATACELAGVKAPANTQSVSFAPTLLGELDAQQEHEYLYWEFYERAGKQALRFGDWKAIRKPMHTGEIELYDLGKDLGEENDVSAENPAVIDRAKTLFKKAHVSNPNWKNRPAKK